MRKHKTFLPQHLISKMVCSTLFALLFHTAYRYAKFYMNISERFPIPLHTFIELYAAFLNNTTNSVSNNLLLLNRSCLNNNNRTFIHSCTTFIYSAANSTHDGTYAYSKPGFMLRLKLYFFIAISNDVVKVHLCKVCAVNVGVWGRCTRIHTLCGIFSSRYNINRILSIYEVVSIYKSC